MRCFTRWVLIISDHRRPFHSQLLDMDGFVGLSNLLFQLSDLQLVHLLNLVISLKISSFEVSEFPLQFFKLSGNSLVFFSQFLILKPELSINLQLQNVSINPSHDHNITFL